MTNFKKYVFITILVLIGVLGGYWLVTKSFPTKLIVLAPFSSSKEVTKSVAEAPKPLSIFAGKTLFNVLLIGTDRRSKTEGVTNTDVLILVSVNTKTNRVLLTSVPRDLWMEGNKINALYAVNGWETLKKAYEDVTGQKIDGYIMCDFQDFKWLVDSFGGVPVGVETTFTDNQFPNDTDTAVTTVNFKQGVEEMTGSRALTFARSRKGDNGEGSDLMRAHRQHLILKGMIQAISQPNSQFWPMDIKKFYGTVTAVGKMTTTLSLDDALLLWDFYKDREKYQLESFVIGDKYIYFPGLYPQSEYHAWVFIPRESTFAQLHKDIVTKLEGTYVDPEAPQTPPAPAPSNTVGK